jgi:hypothetical protein
MKTQHAKFMGYNKSSTKRAVHSGKWLHLKDLTSVPNIILQKDWKLKNVLTQT